MKSVITLFLAVFLTGCASSHVLVGAARPPIEPEQVRVYLEPPASYETVALLEASNRGALNFTDQGRTNTVIWRLKEEAAALGANGILLQGMGNQYAGSVGSGNAWVAGNHAYGAGFTAAVMNRTGSGLAIYVPYADSPAHVEAAPTALRDTPVLAPTVDGTVEDVRVYQDGAAQVEAAPAAPATRQQLDPAKRCDACGTLSYPRR